MADEPTATATSTATFAAAVAADVTILRAEKAAAKAEAAAEAAVCPTTTTTNSIDGNDENYYRAFAVLNKRVPIKNTDKQQLLLDFAQLDVPSFMCNEDDGQDSTVAREKIKEKIIDIYKILPKERPSITILNKSWQKDFTATNIASLYSNWKIYRKLIHFYYSYSRTTRMNEGDEAVAEFFHDFEKMMDEYIITQTAQDKFLHLKIENANKRKSKEAHTMQQHILNTVAARKKPRLPITSGNGQVSTLPVSLSAVTATSLPVTATISTTRTRTQSNTNNSNNSRTKAIVFENDNDDIETVICPCDGIHDDTNLLDVMKIAQRNCSTIFTHIDDATLQKRFKMELQIIQSSSSSMNSMNLPISINNAKTLTVYDLFNFGISNDNNSNGSSSSSNNNNNNGYSMCKIKIITGGFSDNTTL
ncbi:hypothetical protein FRACYDRAFT_236385 [Fragilariopsis cylindrus CCMP1102]|uniref:Uncharacterized protein n=1 Tax=Fragilariopsis cylindrus CCMP1102 TaxID=635003 RepID=A0A1E7FQ65_9STRA|nr:hypothetical protein FRACYDRAFT_236385 [Fragilariopsis cylindrus CCMP1102]|eukprot:OEU20310.1 hypothetical protein FRACYDRAFT_236385 [Fragilariopsis cylindrus CCMP1102]